jgi:hypothetical protein
MSEHTFEKRWRDANIPSTPSTPFPARSHSPTELGPLEKPVRNENEKQSDGDERPAEQGEEEKDENTVRDSVMEENRTSEEMTVTKPVRPEDTIEGCGYPEIPEPKDPARTLQRKDLRNQKLFFLGVIIFLNVGMAMFAVFANQKMVIFIFILFIKSRDFLSALLSAFGLLTRRIYRIFKPPVPVPEQWILTLIPTYSESEEQIVKTIYSLRDNEVGPHKQVMVVLLDGKPRKVRDHMTRIVREFQRPYTSLKHKRGVLNITAGFAQDVPGKRKPKPKLSVQQIYSSESFRILDNEACYLFLNPLSFFGNVC